MVWPAQATLPPWARETPKITDVLPLLYLHGLSSGDFVPALGQVLGSAAGLSAPVITRLGMTAPSTRIGMTRTPRARAASISGLKSRRSKGMPVAGITELTDCIVDNSLRMWTTEGPRPG